MSAPNALEMALLYAKQGLHVFPVWEPIAEACSCPKGADCGRDTGKHPRTHNGLNDATCDEAKIRQWWTRWPTANIGLALEPSGLIALDVDTPAAYETLDRLGIGSTARQRSGSGNAHVLAKKPAFEIRGNYEGITLRGKNYIVVAPSLHKSGGRYEWITPPWECEPITLPDEIAEKFRRRVATAPAQPRSGHVDNELMLKRAKAWLAKAEPAVEGQHGEGVLFRVACKLVHGFELTDWDALSALLEVYNPRCIPPWGDDEVDEVERKIHEARTKCADPSAFRVQDRPRDEVGERRRKKKSASAPIDVAATEHAGIGPMGGYRLTDLGNARRFADGNRDGLRYVFEWGEWLVWDGRRWNRDAKGGAQEAAKRVVAGIYADAAACAATAAAAVNANDVSFKGAPVEEMAKWARSCSKRGAIESMIALARSEPELATNRSAFDVDRFVLNVANGTVDLRHGELRPHRQSDMLTKLSPVEYDPMATAPLWERFLEHVQPDPEIRSWLQRYLGYALTGDVREQCLSFMFGAGANGKSVLLDVVLGVLGDYGCRAAPDLVLAKHGEAHPTEIADLDGKRLVVCSEIEQGRMWAESLIKRITGDTTITARRMKQDFYTFAATHKLAIAANTKPKVRGTDHGIWRRMRLVPWAVQIPDEKQDRDLPAKLLAAEASGILAWLVRGCLEWQRCGLGTVASIETATRRYREDEDVLGRWIEDRCELGPSRREATSQLYASFKVWCEAEGIDAWSRSTWRSRMLEREGIEDHRTKTERELIGVSLKGAL